MDIHCSVTRGFGGNLCFSPLSSDRLSAAGTRPSAAGPVRGVLAGPRPFGGGDKEAEGADPEAQLGAVTAPGSLLQHVLHFREAGPVPCPPLPPAPALAALARSPPGSRVWDALLASPAAPAAPAAAASASSRVTSSRWRVTATAAASSTLSGPRPPPPPAPPSPRSWHPSATPCSTTPTAGAWPGPLPSTSSSAAAACGSSYRRPLTAAGGSWDPSWRTDACPGAQSGVPGDREAPSWMTMGHREEEQAQSVPCVSAAQMLYGEP
ncbi:protein enabled homolog [Phalacrocorax carbo]|uniref:protein enabled homolog n=1 Tax=Phalacrocorax carbo TaxID=9209 RepID=UPI0031196400